MVYQTPMDILIKASNSASDYGNKFGQPLITGSVLTFEHEEDARKLGLTKLSCKQVVLVTEKQTRLKKIHPKMEIKL